MLSVVDDTGFAFVEVSVSSSLNPGGRKDATSTSLTPFSISLEASVVDRTAGKRAKIEVLLDGSSLVEEGSPLSVGVIPDAASFASLTSSTFGLEVEVGAVGDVVRMVVVVGGLVDASTSSSVL